MEVKQTNVIKICLVGYEKTAKLILVKLFVEVVYGKRRNTFSYDVDDVFDESLNAYTENLFFFSDHVLQVASKQLSPY